MNALTTTSVHAAHAYRAWAQPASASGTMEIAQNTQANRRIEAVKIELSSEARNHLAQAGGADQTSGAVDMPGLDNHKAYIAPDGAGRREAPMRATTQAPTYHPPGGRLDLQV